MEYTATTTNASNKITAVLTSETASVGIKVNGTAIENEATATWATGENNVVITVSAHNSTGTIYKTEYKVKVTK